MRKSMCMLLLAVCLLATGLQGAAAESVVGEWYGTIRAPEANMTAAVTVTFSASGTYYIKVQGIVSTGSYKVGDESITLTPETPEGLGTRTLYLGFADDKMYISGTVFGLGVDMQVRRAEKEK